MTSADVTIALGSQNIDARVAFDFSLVDRAGDPVNPSEVTVGDEIGLRVTADDLVDQFSSGTLVYAGFLDVLYDADLLTPVDPVSGNYNFDLEFGSEFSEPSGSGTAAVPGLSMRLEACDRIQALTSHIRTTIQRLWSRSILM